MKQIEIYFNCVFSADRISESPSNVSSGLKLPNSVLHFKILPRSDYKQKVDIVLRVKTRVARISLDSKVNLFWDTDTITISTKDGATSRRATGE